VDKENLASTVGDPISESLRHARFRLSSATEAGNETLTNGEFAVGALLRSRKLGAEAPHNKRVERKQNGERDDDDGT
jgi:hypothetical protein